MTATKDYLATPMALRAAARFLVMDPPGFGYMRE
jgi:hypothetical protein